MRKPSISMRCIAGNSALQARRAHKSMLDAELNDFGVQLAMLGGHAADSDG
jgi:hypothetical protein